ncbi:hypothetical protein FK268_09420 [Tsukamurella sputi]|uniref:Uncharacterized protein n=1 Tax=Tsukamurella sputi TaxID=2591848 RepID=A0A5C5RS55_9ACTN|nr:hypothetical protein [Tsukamurella sputi]TWS25398.1 hypothetical protein FK268_09420 [Tsukamurella sputi]
MPSSDGGLSTKREAQPPAEVFDEYTALGKSAAGVWGVRVGAFANVGGQLGYELPAHADGGLVPAAGGEPYPQHHASVWYPSDDSWTSSARRKRHERIASMIVDSTRQLHPEITPV